MTMLTFTARRQRGPPLHIQESAHHVSPATCKTPARPKQLKHVQMSHVLDPFGSCVTFMYQSLSFDPITSGQGSVHTSRDPFIAR